MELAFGKTGTVVDLPDGFDYRVLEARSAVPLDDPASALEAALDRPTGAPPLIELARGKRSAAISVCDITRPAPNRQVLPPVLRRLEAAGIPRESIVILIATGLHRPATDSEIREIVGEEIAGCYRVENHLARDFSAHRHLGSTATGIPVYIDERFVSADLRITAGFIEPHLMLGYSGSRKLVAPGLAAQETIKVIHSPKFMRDPRACEGSIEDNPLDRELREIARMAGQDFIIDVALARGVPGNRPIAGVFAGHPVEAHLRGVGFVSRVMLETLPEPVDAVITTSAGYPLDLTFYQSLKGVTAASHIVKQDGRILLVAACEEGPGAPEFSQMVEETSSADEFMRKILTEPVVVDQWQLEKLGLVVAKAEVLFCVPGLPDAYHASLWGRSFQKPQTAVNALMAEVPAGGSVAVIPEGPYVLAKVAAATKA